MKNRKKSTFLIGLFISFIWFNGFSQKVSTRVFKIIIKTDTMQRLRAKEYKFRIGTSEFHFKDGEYTCSLPNLNSLDTVFSKSESLYPYSVEAYCKFKDREIYQMLYNVCSDQFVLFPKSKSQSNALPKAKLIIRNYLGNDSIIASIPCLERDILLKNNKASRYFPLSKSCYGAMCSSGAVLIGIENKSKRNLIKEEHGSYYDPTYYKTLNFFPLHPSEERLIYEYDFKTETSKLYLK